MSDRAFLAILISAAMVGPASGQSVQTWVGRPTVGDIVRNDLSNVLNAAMDLTSEKAAFNRQIAAARSEFFAKGKTQAGRASVEKNFANLLFAKDMVYASLFIPEGFSEETRVRVHGLQMMTGGHLDGGIPPLAHKEFEAWVEGIRKSLGARSANQLLILTDQARLQAALKANEPLYARYKERRDIAEFAASGDPAAMELARRYGGVVAAPEVVVEARAADGSPRLFKQEVRGIHSGAYRFDLINQALRRELALVSQAGQKVLDCTYGPVRTSSGQAGYGTYTFWHAAAPPQMGGYLQNDRELAFEHIGATSLTSCPQSENGAIALRRAAMAAHPWARRNVAAPAQPAPPRPPAASVQGLTPAEARAAARRSAN